MRRVGCSRIVWSLEGICTMEAMLRDWEDSVHIERAARVGK